MSRHEFAFLETERDEKELGTIQMQSFGYATGWQTYVRRLGRENFRLLRSAGGVVAGLGLFRMGQWFGGRSVPMAGVAAVAVPPELRGGGLAAELMTRTLEGMADEGVPLSCLYPATQRVYRKVGYEQAGFRCYYRMPISSIRTSDRTLEMRPVEPADHHALHEMYARWAAPQNGLLDRNSAIWERAVLPRFEEVKRASVVGAPGHEEGYVVFHQTAGTRGHYDLRVADLVALSGTALRRLFAFFADHRSMAEQLFWSGPPVDLGLFVLPEIQAQVENIDRWMLRITQVERALELRGYPQDAEAELHLEVSDELLEINRGRFVLQVSQGKAEVRRGGRGEMKLDVRALAPLYSSFCTAEQLERLGQLEATPAALVAANRLFAGPQPWMADGF